MPGPGLLAGQAGSQSGNGLVRVQPGEVQHPLVLAGLTQGQD
jgi:hypothetical protein